MRPTEDYDTSHARCWRDIQSIHIGTNAQPYYILCALAHELGHCLSVRMGSHTTRATLIRYNMHIRLSKKQKRGLHSEERRAWRLGFKFLKDSGLPITAQMKRARRNLLNSHKGLKV